MTTPPVPPYGSPDEPPDPYAPRRPHQEPLSPYVVPSDDAPSPGPGDFAAPSGAGGASPSGTPVSPYGPAAGSAPGYPGQQPFPAAGPYAPDQGPAYPAYATPGYPAPGYAAQGYPAPGYAAQGYAAPGYPGAFVPSYAPLAPTNGLAVASMVVSVASLFLCLGLTGVVGLVLGIVALHQCRRDGTRGVGFATAGIVVGAIGTLALAILWTSVVVSGA